jgi:hypothetical protein
MKWETVTDAPCNNVPTSASDVECQNQADGDSPGNGPYDAPMLIIKPAYAVVQAGDTLQYETFLVQNGVEQQINSGLTYTSNHPGMAQIGVESGNAVGLAEGTVTITVSWGGMFASAQLLVVESCSDTTTAMMLLMDVSPSMGQAMPGYGTKLTFAKMAALRMSNELNVAKDSMLLSQFAAAYAGVVAETVDKPLMATAINSLAIVNTQETNLLSSVQSACQDLNGTAATIKVLVVITDGVCKEIGDPTVPNLLAQIAATGVVVMVLGVRASGDGFSLLELLATGGFMGNAYDLWTGQNALDLMSGLKGYLCAGGCNSTEPYTINQGVAEYTGFANWDVASGKVDLFGNGFMDFLPGNGLYVNLAGIGTEDGPLAFAYQWVISALPMNINTLEGPNTPSVSFATPKIVDGIRVRTSLYDYSGTPISDYAAGKLKQFSVYGTNGPMPGTLIKTFILDCTDVVGLNNLIGPASNTILHLGNNTAYTSFYIQLQDACGAETAVVVNSVDWYTKAVANVPSNGRLVTKVAVVSVANAEYWLTVRLAGNQRAEAYADQVRIRVGPVGGPYALDELVTVPWDQPFESQVFSFFADVVPENWYVSIEQVSTATAGAGILLDSVKLEQVWPVSADVFDFGFDAENPQVIQPPCPSAYAYIYTNCGGYGCLDNPPGAQSPDPNPLPKLE